MDTNLGSPAGAPSKFYPPRLRLLLLVLTCAFIGATCYIMTLSAFSFLTGLGWTGVAAMGLAGLVLLLRALRPGPTVVLDDQGITDRTTMAAPELVRWDEITVIRKKEIGRGGGAERLLEVVLSDPQEFHSRPRGWRRRLIERYRALLKQPLVSIPGSMVSAPLPELMDTIRQRRPQLQVLEGPPPAPPKFRFSRKSTPTRRHPDLPRW